MTRCKQTHKNIRACHTWYNTWRTIQGGLSCHPRANHPLIFANSYEPDLVWSVSYNSQLSEHVLCLLMCLWRFFVHRTISRQACRQAASWEKYSICNEITRCPQKLKKTIECAMQTYIKSIAPRDSIHNLYTCPQMYGSMVIRSQNSNAC